MDSSCADPNTRVDVDLLIVDYLACLTIETILSGRRSEREGQQNQWDASWLLSSVNKCVVSKPVIKSILPRDPHWSLSQDISVKIQILTFAHHFFLRYTHQTLDDRPGNLLSPDQAKDNHHDDRDPPADGQGDRVQIRQIQALSDSLANDVSGQQLWTSQSALDSNYRSMLRGLKIEPSSASPRAALLPLYRLVKEFTDLCTTAPIDTPGALWLDITARLVAMAAVEELFVLRSISTEELCRRLSWAPDDQDMARQWIRARERYLDHLLPSSDGKPAADYLGSMPKELSLFQLEGMVIDFLFDAMRSLEPPVLLQLERGKLGDLSRAETQALKDRIGL